MKTFKSYITEEFLLEVNYEDMFAKWLDSTNQEDDNKQHTIKNEISWAKKWLKKNDRITWYLRILKLRLRMIDAISQNSSTERSEEIKAVLKDVDDLKKKAGNDSGYNKLISNLQDTPNWRKFSLDLEEKLKHFTGMKIPAIDSYTFKYESPEALLDKFKELEEKYYEKYKDLVPSDDDDKNTPIVEFPNGWKWFNLNKSYCDKEAKAMGHCGNIEGQTRTSDRILSLREPVKVGDRLFWQPHLTFILNADSELGETKGKANEKPAAKYHPYIVSLLTNKKIPIRGIAGGGYLPESNFDLDDLSDEDLQKVVAGNENLKKDAEISVNSKEFKKSLYKQIQAMDDSWVNSHFNMNIKDIEEKRLHEISDISVEKIGDDFYGIFRIYDVDLPIYKNKIITETSNGVEIKHVRISMINTRYRYISAADGVDYIHVGDNVFYPVRGYPDGKPNRGLMVNDKYKEEFNEYDLGDGYIDEEGRATYYAWTRKNGWPTAIFQDKIITEIGGIEFAEFVPVLRVMAKYKSLFGIMWEHKTAKNNHPDRIFVQYGKIVKSIDGVPFSNVEEFNLTMKENGTLSGHFKYNGARYNVDEDRITNKKVDYDGKNYNISAK